MITLGSESLFADLKLFFPPSIGSHPGQGNHGHSGVPVEKKSVACLTCAPANCDIVYLPSVQNGVSWTLSSHVGSEVVQERQGHDTDETREGGMTSSFECHNKERPAPQTIGMRASAIRCLPSPPPSLFTPNQANPTRLTQVHPRPLPPYPSRPDCCGGCRAGSGRNDECGPDDAPPTALPTAEAVRAP